MAGETVHADAGLGKQGLDLVRGGAWRQGNGDLDRASLVVGGEGDGLAQPDMGATGIELSHALPHFRARCLPGCLHIICQWVPAERVSLRMTSERMGGIRRVRSREHI